MVSKSDSEIDILQNFIGYITHAVNSQIFYAITNEDLERINKAMKGLDFKKLEKFFWLPGVDKLFLIGLPDEPLMRAMRTETTKKNFIDFFFLDTGETFQFSFHDMGKMDVYKMPRHLQEIQPGAFQCLLAPGNRYVKQDPDFLLNSIYGKFTVKVLNIEEDGTLYVDIEKYENIDLILKPIVEKKVENRERDFELEMMEKINACFEKNEPIIFDAQVAVQGFHTNDDKRRCKFYDQKTKACWKKGRCKQKHIADLVDGTCRDRKLVQVYDINEPSRPKRNLFYSIEILFFIDLNRFTAHFINKESTLIYREKSLCKLREKLGTGSFKKSTVLPAVGEVVVVNIKDKFYRARILEEIDDFMTFPVYLVDEGKYGEHVSYEYIYEYPGFLLDFPFFAVEFTIADIKPRKNNPHDKEAQQLILEIQKNEGPLKALIVENLMEIRCTLYNKNMEGISQILIDRKLVKPKTIAPPEDFKQQYLFPG